MAYVHKSKEEKQAQIQEITDKLEQGIKDVFTSEKYINYLKTMSKFYNYSFRNNILILLQNPDASNVAGFTTWKNKFNRTVNKGEKGIQILAPAPYKKTIDDYKKDSNGNYILNATGEKQSEQKEIIVPAYRPTYVFDLSQTSGDPLPELTTELTGNVNDYNTFLESLKHVSPFPIEFEDIPTGAKGYCELLNHRIAIKNGMSEAQTIKTVIHEITHANLHSFDTIKGAPDISRSSKEVEAESVAFTVCHHYGIDTSDYSFNYVAGWSKDKELSQLKNSLDTIQKTAHTLITNIDVRFAELQKEQCNNLEAIRYDEMLDSVKFDNDIDLDRETRPEQRVAALQEKVSLKDKITVAKEQSVQQPLHENSDHSNTKLCINER